MKKAYAQPSLVQYGELAQITLGASGTLPDLDTNLTPVNANCVEQELGGGLKTTFCIVAGGGASN